METGHDVVLVMHFPAGPQVSTALMSNAAELLPNIEVILQQTIF